MPTPEPNIQTRLQKLKRVLGTRKIDFQRNLGIQLNRFQKTQLPGLIIIGAQKAGTGSLARYLNSNPYFKRAVIKEVRYFSQDHHYQQGIGWYKRRFGPVNEQNILTFEASPDYMNFPDVAERIKADLPNIKLIALVRDPVKRAYSSWNMFRMLRNDPIAKASMIRRHLKYLDPRRQEVFLRMLTDHRLDDFMYTIEAELSLPDFEDMMTGVTFVRNGIYADRLTPFMEHFGPDQLMIIESTQLRLHTAKSLGQIYDFLNVPHFDLAEEQMVQFHVRPYQEKISAECHKKLTSFYASHNQRLYNLIDRTFNW